MVYSTRWLKKMDGNVQFYFGFFLSFSQIGIDVLHLGILACIITTDEQFHTRHFVALIPAFDVNHHLNHLLWTNQIVYNSARGYMDAVTNWSPLCCWHDVLSFIFRHLLHFDKHSIEVYSRDLVENEPAFLQGMVWRQTSDKPLLVTRKMCPCYDVIICVDNIVCYR